MRSEYIYIIIIVIIVIIYNCNFKEKEKFINLPLTTNTLKQYIYNIYQADINAINNLSNIITTIINGNLITSNINIKGQLNLTNNTNYLSFIKNGTSGNIHSWNINNPSNSNDLSILSSTQEILRLNTTQVKVIKNIIIGGTLDTPGNGILNQIKSTKININNPETTTKDFNLKGDICISGNVEFNNLTIGGTINDTLIIPGDTNLNTLTVQSENFKSAVGTYNFQDLYYKVQLLKTQILLNGVYFSTSSEKRMRWLVINGTDAHLIIKTKIENTPNLILKQYYTINFSTNKLIIKPTSTNISPDATKDDYTISYTTPSSGNNNATVKLTVETPYDPWDEIEFEFTRASIIILL